MISSVKTYYNKVVKLCMTIFSEYRWIQMDRMTSTFLVIESSESEGIRVDTWKMTSTFEVA